MEWSDTREKPTGLRVSLGAIANTNSLQAGMNLLFPVCHCPPPAAVPSLQRSLFTQWTNPLLAAPAPYRRCSSAAPASPHTGKREGQKQRDPLVKYLGNSDCILMQNIFISSQDIFVYTAECYFICFRFATDAQILWKKECLLSVMAFKKSEKQVKSTS